jgi:hypothetical protein
MTKLKIAQLIFIADDTHDHDFMTHIYKGEYVMFKSWFKLPNFILGPLHTRAKSRDHVIVRAQKRVSKGRPKTPLKTCIVVMDPQV